MIAFSNVSCTFSLRKGAGQEYRRPQNLVQWMWRWVQVAVRAGMPRPVASLRASALLEGWGDEHSELCAPEAAAKQISGRPDTRGNTVDRDGSGSVVCLPTDRLLSLWVRRINVNE